MLVAKIRRNLYSDRSWINFQIRVCQRLQMNRIWNPTYYVDVGNRLEKLEFSSNAAAYLTRCVPTGEPSRLFQGDGKFSPHLGGRAGLYLRTGVFPAKISDEIRDGNRLFREFRARRIHETMSSTATSFGYVKTAPQIRHHKALLLWCKWKGSNGTQYIGIYTAAWHIILRSAECVAIFRQP